MKKSLFYLGAMPILMHTCIFVLPKTKQSLVQ